MARLYYCDLILISYSLRVATGAILPQLVESAKVQRSSGTPTKMQIKEQKKQVKKYGKYNTNRSDGH